MVIDSRRFYRAALLQEQVFNDTKTYLSGIGVTQLDTVLMACGAWLWAWQEVMGVNAPVLRLGHSFGKRISECTLETLSKIRDSLRAGETDYRSGLGSRLCFTGCVVSEDDSDEHFDYGCPDYIRWLLADGRLDS